MHIWWLGQAAFWCRSAGEHAARPYLSTRCGSTPARTAARAHHRMWSTPPSLSFVDVVTSSRARRSPPRDAAVRARGDAAFVCATGGEAVAPSAPATSNALGIGDNAEFGGF
jgi:hypothetical protein